MSDKPAAPAPDAAAIMALADEYWRMGRHASDLSEEDAARAALRAAVEQIMRENFTLAAGQCIVDGGLVMGEYGNGVCTMRERAERAEQDAARYRWLRDHGDEMRNGVQIQITRYLDPETADEMDFVSCGLLYDAADAAIDAAMKENK